MAAKCQGLMTDYFSNQSCELDFSTNVKVRFSAKHSEEQLFYISCFCFVSLFCFVVYMLLHC